MLILKLSWLSSGHKVVPQQFCFQASYPERIILLRNHFREILREHFFRRRNHFQCFHFVSDLGGREFGGERSKWPKTPLFLQPAAGAARKTLFLSFLEQFPTILRQKSMIIRKFPEIWRFCTPKFGGERIFSPIFGGEIPPHPPQLGGKFQHW